MISFRDFVQAFRQVGLNPEQPVIVHASLSSVGEIRGGAETVLGALLSLARGVMAPTFTYKTMITPEVGPENNAMTYGTGKDQNRMAEFFRPEMPADPMMGVLPETVRSHPNAHRSSHPILSFAGINVDDALAAQTIEDHLAPIGVLAAQGGVVLLIGVDHTANTSIHYAEKLAGRKRFVRWALTPQGVRECPGFSGCSNGFQQAEDEIASFTRVAQVGNAVIRAVQLAPMIDTLTALIQRQPLALLCNSGDERCEEVRRAVAASMPAANMPAATMPAATMPEVGIPADDSLPMTDDLPAADLPEAEVPAVEMPAPSLPETETAAIEIQAIESFNLEEGEANMPEANMPEASVPEASVPEVEITADSLAEEEASEIGTQGEDISTEDSPADFPPPLATNKGRKTRPLPELHGDDEPSGEPN